MDHFEVADTLKSFRIIVDTREHSTPKAVERYEALGVPTERATLNYGDYCGNVTFPDGNCLFKPSTRISPPCVIERKMSLDELAACFGTGRDRFQREFERAKTHNAKTFLLIENGSWEAIVNHRYRSRLSSNAFLASLAAWTVRYNMVPIFCKSGTSGTMIREILFRDMKERLERGEYG